MATDPKTIIDINADPGLSHPTGYVPKKDFDAGQPEVKTVVINYTDPAPYGTPELQIFNDPGGANGSVQYNLANRLVGDGNFVWNYKTRTLSILGNLRVSNNIAGYITTNTKHFKLTGGNVGDTIITDGHGNLSWVAPGETAYGNANVANYLPTYNGNIGGIISNSITAIHSNLGNVANITILGGSNGQFLSTDGNGHLSWSTANGGGNTSIIISDNAPTSVSSGSVWFNSVEARAYIYYDDVWVDLSPTVLPPANSSTTVTVSNLNPGIQREGDIWFNTNEGRSYVGYEDTWVDMSPAILPNPDMFANTITFPDGSEFTTANVELLSYSNSNVANYLPTYTGSLSSDDLNVLNLSNGQILISGPTGNVVGGPDLLWEFDNAALFVTGLKSNGYVNTVDLTVTGLTNLGSIDNLQIDGGTNGYVLSTDGAGALSWVPQTGGPGGDYSNTNVASYLSSGTLTSNIITTGNIVGNKLNLTGNITSANANLGNVVTGNYFRGNASFLSYITAANVIGAVANAAYAANAGNATIASSAVTASAVTTNAQPNITSLGTLSNIEVSGLSNLANITLNGNIISDLNVTGNVVGGAVRTTSSSTAPLSPVPGDMWYNTTSGVWYRYTNDGSNNYWLDINGPSITTPIIPINRSIVNAGQPVTMDNIQVQFAPSGNRSLQIKTITGTITFNVSGFATYFSVGTSQFITASGITLNANTTFQNITTWSFIAAGDCATYNLLDQVNNRVYRLYLLVGQGWNNNFIQIERLI
jgi:hypothetical protein